METKKVSIIIPIYNGEKYLERSVMSCVNSARIDTVDLEILLLDDGSTDKSESIARGLAALYPLSVKYLRHSNIGVCETRNKGIELASGEYFTFLDQDDYFEPMYLYKLHDAATKYGCDLVVSGMMRTDEAGRLVKRSRHTPLFNTEMTTLLSASCWGKLYKTSFAKDVRFKSLKIGEDIGFLANLVVLKPKIKIIRYVGYNWFFNTNSVSNTELRSLKDNISNIYALQDHLRSVGPENPLIKCLATVYSCYGVFFAGKYDNDVEWKRYATDAMRNLERIYPDYAVNKVFWLSPETFLNTLSLLSKIFVIFYRLKLIALLAKARRFAVGL